MQSLPITTKVVSSNPVHDEVYSIQHLCDKVCQWLTTCRWFSPGIPVSSTNKTDCHVITEILLKVVLNTINQTKPTTYPHKPSFCVHKGLQKLVGSFIDPWLDMMQKSNMAVTAGHSTTPFHLTSLIPDLTIISF